MRAKRTAPTTADKVVSYFAAKKAAKDAYDLADRLLVEIAKELKPGVPFPISENEAALLHNNFKGKSVVWGHGGVRKWELEKIQTAAQEA
jgi:hypothetical protein